MFTLLCALAISCEDPPLRTPAIYRFPAKEAGYKGIGAVIDEDGWDSLCVEPAPTAELRERAKGKLKFVEAKTIDTAANLKWRNAAIEFANGKISPAAFVTQNQASGATIHFLSSPKTKDLRSATPTHPGDGTFSARSVFAEFLLLSWPGRFCLTADDIWLTRDLPDDRRHESWVLAMRDRLGPQMALRAEKPFLVTGKIQVIRADAKPGLLIWKMTDRKRSYTFAMNNSDAAIEAPNLNVEHLLGLYRGVDLDGKKPMLQGCGFYIQED